MKLSCIWVPASSRKKPSAAVTPTCSHKSDKVSLPDADLLIYGCNFGQGEAGQEAMETLAELTGADIAASTDRTGHST